MLTKPTGGLIDNYVALYCCRNPEVSSIAVDRPLPILRFFDLALLGCSAPQNLSTFARFVVAA
jgi:hypothetical protein